MVVIDVGQPLALVWCDFVGFVLLDVVLVNVGEQSGQLAPVFRMLVDHYW